MADTSEFDSSGQGPSPPPRKGARREPRLEMRRYFCDDRCRLSLVGEVRHGSAESLLGKVQEMFESGCRYVLLDLSEVSYCDTAGLQSLVQIYKYLQGRTDLTFIIFAPEGMVMETLRTCRFDKFLQITQDMSILNEGWQPG